MPRDDSKLGYRMPHNGMSACSYSAVKCAMGESGGMRVGAVAAAAALVMASPAMAFTVAPLCRTPGAAARWEGPFTGRPCAAVGYKLPYRQTVSWVKARGDPDLEERVVDTTEPALLEEEASDEGLEVKKAFDKESRQLVGLLAGLGTMETAFLTYKKLFSEEGLGNLCSVGGMSLRCGDVLNSEYANVLGIPLTLPAIFAYGAVCALALGPLLVPDGTARDEIEEKTRAPLLLLTTSMATFSGYLMWLLATKLGEACPFCLASATLSFSMAYLTWTRNAVPVVSRATVYKVGSVLTSVLLSGLVYLITSTQALVASQSMGYGDGSAGPYAPPAITQQSDERSMRVAERLQAMDSRMYGAFWCSHCYEQKQTLGKEAYSRVKYIECAKDGVNSQTALCKERKVPGYPTWEIKGELYPGEKTLEQLEELTGLREPAPVTEEGDLSPIS